MHMLVEEIMTKGIKSIGLSETIKKTAQIMSSGHLGSLIVIDQNAVAGIVTEYDIVRAFAQGKDPMSHVKTIMSKKVIVVDRKATLREAADLMQKNRIKKLPVMEKLHLVGIVTASDLIRYERKLLKKLDILFEMKKKALEEG